MDRWMWRLRHFKGKYEIYREYWNSTLNYLTNLPWPKHRNVSLPAEKDVKRDVKVLHGQWPRLGTHGPITEWPPKCHCRLLAFFSGNACNIFDQNPAKQLTKLLWILRTALLFADFFRFESVVHKIAYYTGVWRSLPRLACDMHKTFSAVRITIHHHAALLLKS